MPSAVEEFVSAGMLTLRPDSPDDDSIYQRVEMFLQNETYLNQSGDEKRAFISLFDDTQCLPVFMEFVFVKLCDSQFSLTVKWNRRTTFLYPFQKSGRSFFFSYTKSVSKNLGD